MAAEPKLEKWDESNTILKPKLVMKISIRILEQFPVEIQHVESLFDPEELAGGSSEEVFKLCRTLIPVWKFLIFHQPKQERMEQALSENGFPEGVILGIAEVLKSEIFLKVVDKLAGCSFSSLPKVYRTNWASESIVARNDAPSSSTDRQVTITFSTDQGPKKIHLTLEELERLYWTNNDIQSSLDNLLER